MKRYLGLFTLALTLAFALAACSPLGERTFSASLAASRSLSDTMFIRGSFNGWKSYAMRHANEGVWEISVRFSAPSGNAFKFDRSGDWSWNYGDDGADGSLERNGANIAVAPGDYNIWLYESSGTYEIKPVTFSTLRVAFDHVFGDAATSSLELSGLEVRVERNGHHVTRTDGSGFRVASSGGANPVAELVVSDCDPGCYRVVIDGVKDASLPGFDYGIRHFTCDSAFDVDGSAPVAGGTAIVTSFRVNDAVRLHFREWGPAASYGVKFSDGLSGSLPMTYEGFINGRHWWAALLSDLPASFSFTFYNSEGVVDSGKRWYRGPYGVQDLYVEAFNGEVYTVRP